MTAVNELLRAYNTPDTAIAGASMNALADGAWALGAEIDNSTGLYTLGDFALDLSSAVTAGSGSPFIAIYLLPNVSGNYRIASAADPGTAYWWSSIALVASAAFQYVQLPRIVLTQKFKLLLLNKAGAAFPSTNTSVAALYRHGLQIV